MNSAVGPPVSQRRWAEAPYTDLHRLRVGDQLVRQGKLSFLAATRMKPREFTESAFKLGATWAYDYYNPRNDNLVVYHHGIYCGDNKVIDIQNYGVRELSVADFADGWPVHVYRHPKNRYVYPGPVVAARARACLTKQGIQFHGLFNNCEAFATFCSTGRTQSDAVDIFADRLFRTAIGLCITASRFPCSHWLWVLLIIMLVIIVTAAIYAGHRFVQNKRKNRLNLPVSVDE